MAEIPDTFMNISDTPNETICYVWCTKHCMYVYCVLRVQTVLLCLIQPQDMSTKVGSKGHLICKVHLPMDMEEMCSEWLMLSGTVDVCVCLISSAYVC